MRAQVFLTGHSLGGALATLAAYDIAQALRAVPQRTHVACYSFGAPRVGNHAFADDYARLVPDTWSIINDQVRVWGAVCCLFLVGQSWC